MFLTQYFTDIFSKGIWSDARELEDLGVVVLVKELKSPLQKSYPLELKLGQPLNSKDPISLELVGKLCVNYASSSSLGHLRFLVFLLLGYAGFLRVDELHSLKVGDISLLMTIWQSPSGSEKKRPI